MQQLVLQPLVDKLMQALAEDIALPYLARVLLEISKQALDKLFRLAFAAHDGRDLCGYLGPYHIDGRRAGPQAYAVASALMDDLRLFQRQLVDARHHNAIARGVHLVQRAFDLFVLRFDARQIDDARHEACFVAYLKPRCLSQHFVKDIVLQLQRHSGAARAQVYELHLAGLDIWTLHGPRRGCDVLHHAGARRKLLYRCIYSLLQPMSVIQHRDPFGHRKRDLLERELKQHVLEDLGDGLLRQLHTAHGHDGTAVFFAQLLGQSHALQRLRRDAVEQNDKRLLDGLQLLNDALLGLLVAAAWDIADGTVRGDDKADGGMLTDDLSRAGFRRYIERDLFVEPGAFHHAGLFIFLVTHGAGHHVAHAVDETCAEGGAVLKVDGDRLFGHEFRLGRHDGSPGGGLRQFVARPLAERLALDLRQHHQFHKAFDESAFARAHRPDDADVDVAACTSGDVCIKIAMIHPVFSPLLK